MQCLTHGKTLNLPSGAADIINTLGRQVYDASDDMKANAKIVIDRIRAYHTPCDREWLKGAIFTLLQHYYVRDISDQVQKAIAQDWIAVLEEFPSWAIEKARIEHLKYGDRKPLPKDIADLCKSVMRKNFDLLKHCEHIISLPSPLDAPNKEDREKILKEFEDMKKNIAKSI